jgi:hypothetical protein
MSPPVIVEDVIRVCVHETITCVSEFGVGGVALLPPLLSFSTASALIIILELSPTNVRKRRSSVARVCPGNSAMNFIQPRPCVVINSTNLLSCAAVHLRSRACWSVIVVLWLFCLV